MAGELPQELGNLPFLELFSVYNNSLSGFIPSSIFNISTLKNLDLSFNQFSGNLPPNMGNLLSYFNLEQLYLDTNQLSGEIPSSVTNASSLTLLDLSNNSFSGSIPDFGNLRLLQILVIGVNNLRGAESEEHELGFLSSLNNCQYLKMLAISYNPLNGILPSSIGNLSSSLQWFEAWNCNIKGVIPPEIENLSSLNYLSFNGNQLEGSIPRTIGKLKQLQRLFLSKNGLHGHIPADICQMSNLGELYMRGNTLTGPIPECIGDLKYLQILDIGSNKLNSDIPSSLWNLRDLLALKLSSNFLTGQLASQIGSLKVVNLLDLSSNKISGEIPSLIDGCQSLEILRLSNNMLRGSIPESLGNVRGLTKLDLSNNSLSGLIPRSLEELQFLENFNVSYNKLEGEIPNGGRFVSFNAVSVDHNSALCGAARFEVPPCIKKLRRSSRENVVRLMKYVLPPFISAIILAVIVLLILVRKRKAIIMPSSADHIELAIAWRRISYAELVQGTNSFSETNLLGKGSFGSVFKGTLSDGFNAAVKVFNMQLERAARSFATECEILSTIRHRNLVRIIGCCSNTQFKALILEYMPNGSLEKWLYSDNCSLNLVQRLETAIDVASALEYLHHGHTFPVVHCDIKPSNILLDDDMTAHLGDFGISKLFEEGEAVIQTTTMATIGYAAPEYGSEGKVSTKGDVYSYGITLLEMFTGKKPSDDMFGEEMSLKEWVIEALQENATSEVSAPGLVALEDGHFSAKEECLSSIFGVAMKCLALSPKERTDMSEVVAVLSKIKAKLAQGCRRRRHRQYAMPSAADNTS